MAKSNTAKTAAPPKPIRLRIKLGVSKAPGLSGTVWIENVEFDGPRTSLLFGRYYKVCVYVNEKTKTVVPVLYLDNGNYGGVVECRHMSGGAPNCIPMVERTPHGNMIEFAYVAEDLLKAVASQAMAQPAAAPPAASNGGAPATTKAPAKKAEAEPEEDDDDDEDEGDAEAEGDEEEGDEEGDEGEEGDEDEGEEGDEGGEAEGDAEEGDDEPNFAEMTRDALVDAVTQLKKEGVTIEWAKDWSDAKLRKAVEAGYAEYMAQDDAEGEEEGDDDADEEGEGDAEEGDEEGDEGEEGDEAESEGDEEEGDEEEAPAPPKKKKKKVAPAPAPIKKKKKKKSVGK